MMQRPGPLAPGAADGLARLALGLGRDGAGVDDHRVAEPGGCGVAAHHLGFEGVQAAAEGDDLDPGHGHSANSEGAMVPVKLTATGPVIST